MKQKRSAIWNNLAYRALASLLCFCLLAVLSCVCSLPLWVVILCVALLLLVVWQWIALPYIRVEKMIRQYLNGYTLSATEQIQVAISPATRTLFEQFQELMNPTELFQKNKRQAQYLALQNQINPHFLYNTLESIRSEVLMAGLLEVADMTESLASFFRYTISKVENLVSVEEELQNCITYFSIQQYRFGDRLMLNISCSPEDKEEIYHCRLPKLTMQPILENSIIHGTEAKLGTGHLSIHLELTGTRLLIRISDDGLGMDEETLLRLNKRLGRGNLTIAKQESSRKGGLALANVDNRIRLLFGDEYGVHVFSVPGVGTDVEISIPAINSDREVKNSEVLQ